MIHFKLEREMDDLLCLLALIIQITKFDYSSVRLITNKQTMQTAE